MGLIIKLSLPNKKMIAFKRNRIAKSGSTAEQIARSQNVDIPSKLKHAQLLKILNDIF